MSVLFYKNVQPLNSEKHRQLHLEPFPEDFSFARTTPMVPLAATEFFSACRHYPILFSGQDDNLLPVAILGYTEQQNQFVNDQNQWQSGAYIPAFVRRYPFILAQDKDQDQQTVCFDRQWKGFNEEGRGPTLFTETGEQSEPLQQVIRFIEALHRDMQRTQLFLQFLQQNQLLQKRDLQISNSQGNTFVLKDFRILDEQAFMKLADEQVLAFHKNGWLPWVYAHLLSLSNLSILAR